MTDKERAIIREFLPSILFVPRFGQKLGRYIAAQFLTRPANAKNPANLTACGVSWSWQCDSNTRPADYEPDSVT